MAIAVWTSFEQLSTDAFAPLAGGSVTVYQDGTTTLISLFSDELLTVSAANPITPLDAAGRHPIRYFAAESYKTVIKNSAGTTLWTIDDIDPGVPLGTGVLAVANGGTGASTAATARTNLDVPSNAELAAISALVSALGGAINPPGGRLTLTTAVPVMTSDVTAATTVYYTPYIHGNAHLYNGTSWAVHTFTELSQTLADSTKSPAATSADNNYDMFLWDDAGTKRCTRGPAWTTATDRSASPHTSQNGVRVNTNAITNGPGALKGLYVGTIRTNASNQVAFMPATAAAAGGGACQLYVWNMYNRVDLGAVSKDSTDSWVYTTATIRAANNNNNNRISVVAGLNEDYAFAEYQTYASTDTAGTELIAGIGLDSTTAFSGSFGKTFNSLTIPVTIRGAYHGLLGLGHHFVQALEWSEATGGNTTWYGDNAIPLLMQMTLTLRWRA